MQGKGAGAVNRVELESQVLCAALRQSFHLKDRIGAFTSVRELSHLFPDLLPPPEKDDDFSLSNKANFYAEIGVRPQTSANGVLSGYLRTVRTFLRSRKVQDSRVEYNRILNAGFILRKPRLRLSHDLVVSRRWLHEESRMAQIASQEVTQDQAEAVRFTKGGQPVARQDSAAAAAELLLSAQPPAPLPVASPPVLSQNYAAPPMVPVEPPLSVQPPPPVALPMPSLSPPPVNAQTGAQRTGDVPMTRPESRGRVEVPPVPPLPVHVLPPPPVVPPVPSTVNQYWYGQQPEPAAADPGHRLTLPSGLEQPALAGAGADATPDTAFPVFSAGAPLSEAAGRDHADSPITPAVEMLPELLAPPALEVAQDFADPLPYAPAPPVVSQNFPDQLPYVAPPAAAAQEAPAPAQSPYAPPQSFQDPGPPQVVPMQPAQPASVPGNGLHSAAAEGGFPPASVRAQSSAYAQSPVVARERPGGRISNQAAFVFDESQLHRPQSVVKVVPMLIQLMEAAQFITAVEVQALMAQMEFAPNVPVEKLILNAGYVTPHEMASVKLGESLLHAGKITIAQFQVAIYDERTSGLRMAESLQVRGWLSTEVRNAIDEFHKKRI